MNLTFQKERDCNWYIVLPEWKGEKWELQMVSGADTLCDILSEGEDRVTIDLQLEPTKGYDKLSLLSICKEDIDNQETPDNGAFYHLESLRGVEYNLTIWLCDVTLFVLGEFPKTFYIC